MTKWTAPDIASIRGDNSRPLQKIFGSLTEYLNDYQINSLDSLSDVTITTPTVGQVLSYNATNSLWINTTGSVITNLNASNLASGTVPTGRVSGSYAGITSVGTLGSLTITGDLTVDTNTLRVDSTNNRVGINVTSPTSNLDIVGNQVIRAATLQDGIQLAGRVGGTSSLTVKLIPTTLTTNRTITLPNVDGTAITTGNLSSITSVGTLSSGSIPSSLLSGQTGMWTSVNRPGATRLYRNDYDDQYNVQTYWTGARWRLRGYYNNTFHAESEVAYADSAGSASTAGYASTVGSGSGGIPYPGATVGGGAPNNIGFRWTNPYVNCTVDNVISAACANFSDRRLKTNIQTLTNGMDLIRSLRCVTYNPLDVIGFEEETFEPIVGDLDPYDEMIGFIADEVQEVYANAIHGEGNRIKSIDTVQLLSMAVSAIQDLDARLQQLETA